MFIEPQQHRDDLAGLFTNRYTEIQSARLVLDTNGLWCARLPALTQPFPDAKTICCVRDVNWIMDSIERLLRRNAFERSGTFCFESGGTVFPRISAAAGLTGWSATPSTPSRAASPVNRPSMILVDYEALVTNPCRTLQMIYDFIGEPRFA